MKIACLWVPNLSLIAALSAEPQLCAEPLAVVQAGLGGRAHVLGATGAAEGVEAGQTLAEARAICPRLLSREASPERERAAAQAAREAASAVSPRVEEAGPGLVYLDVSGLESLIGDDRAVARAVVAAAERVGVRAAVGLGSSKSVARLAARSASADLTLEASASGVGGGAFRVVPAEEQREFLGALPLYALELPDELQEPLRRFGLSTLGEVAALPPGPLAARLGPAAALLSRLARGEDSSALAPRPEPSRFEEGEELEWDASSVEPLLFVWKGLLDRLAQRLSARGLMARELRLQLRLADGSWDERALDLAAPTREVAAQCRKFAPPPPPRLPLLPEIEVSLASRALRPPRTAEVRCDDSGAPLLVIGEGALGGRVVACAGPWRTVAEWWTDAPLALDAYDLELAGGLLIRAARELATGTWRIEAVYD